MPGMVEELVGCCIGDSRSVEVTFPNRTAGPGAAMAGERLMVYDLVVLLLLLVVVVVVLLAMIVMEWLHCLWPDKVRTPTMVVHVAQLCVYVITIF